MSQTLKSQNVCRGYKEMAFIHAEKLRQEERVNKESKDKKRFILQHSFNGGQVRLPLPDGTEIPVDGFLPEIDMVIEFHGCIFHGHTVNEEPDTEKDLDVSSPVVRRAPWDVRCPIAARYLLQYKDRPQLLAEKLAELQERDRKTKKKTLGLNQMGFQVVEGRKLNEIV